MSDLKGLVSVQPALSIDLMINELSCEGDKSKSGIYFIEALKNIEL